MGRLFGTDGARGVANTELTIELAMNIGRAAAMVLTENTAEKHPKILIGKDTRLSSDMLEGALIAGLCSVGADVVVEGPPMGIMGSGQYSLCLCKMFKALNTTYIPRGYKPVEGFDEILKRINSGHHIAPKPYKIIDKTTNEVLLRDKLE